MKDNTSNPEDIKKWANISRSVLNGIVGDYLAKEHNPLAIEMAFYHHNHPLILNETLAHQLKFSSGKPLTNKVIVLIHGLTNLETVWNFTTDLNAQEITKAQNISPTSSEHVTGGTTVNFENIELDNYGLRIQHDFGYTPLFLRYNTGLSVKENGQNLSDLLNHLIKFYPIQIDELVLMGFSMGGLLTRSAQKIANDNNLAWLEKLTNCYYIGTPHEGSPLEKFGHITSSIVKSIPLDYVNQWADWIDLRSQGIKDLKDGLLNLNSSSISPESNEPDPFKQSVKCGSFVEHAQHHFISGGVSEKKHGVANKIVGDTLVRHSSAHPISAPDNAKNAHFEGITHVPLAHSDKVYQQIKHWFNEHMSDIQTVTFEAQETTTPFNDNTPRLNELSSHEIISGTLDLLLQAYEHSVNSVEKTHHSLVNQTNTTLEKVPTVSKVSKPISKMHKEIINTVYYSLKRGGKLAQKGADFIRPKKDD
jgi:pimeloyl-ACP methyl ester carboxylesterase